MCWMLSRASFLTVICLVATYAHAKTTSEKTSASVTEKLYQEVGFSLRTNHPEALDVLFDPYEKCKLTSFRRRVDGGNYDQNSKNNAIPDCSTERAEVQRLVDRKLIKLGVEPQSDRDAIINNGLLVVDLQADFMAAWTEKKSTLSNAQN